MTGDAITWAESKLDWDKVERRTADFFSEGEVREEALNKAINEQLVDYVNSRTGRSGANTGIFSPEYEGRLWSGGIDEITKQAYGGLGYKVEFELETRLGELDDLKRDLGAGGTARPEGDTVIVKFPDGQENRYYQLTRMAQNRGVI